MYSVVHVTTDRVTSPFPAVEWRTNSVSRPRPCPDVVPISVCGGIESVSTGPKNRREDAMVGLDYFSVTVASVGVSIGHRIAN